MEVKRIFIVEDDLMYARMLEHNLSRNPDYEVERFETGAECLKNLHKRPSVVTIDFNLPDMVGSELMKKVLRFNPEIAVIIISGQKDISTAVGLLREGAFDYIVKDADANDRLWNSIRLLNEISRLKTENERLAEEIGNKYDFSETIIGNSPGIRHAYTLVEKASNSMINVAITGETGTGKELIAKAIHYHSNRKKHPFVAINVGAIPRDLVESELFGYEKGAFTGALSRKAGVFEEAFKGTLFLDEIGEMDLNIQTRFLRVLQEKEVRRLGGSEVIKTDVRIITATHKNLADEVNKGNFRADLYYRLMGLPIHLVPLRERGNDIMVLAHYFADLFCKENKRNPVCFSQEAARKMLQYPFPGNVRELKAVVELAIIMSEGHTIEAGHISFNPVQKQEDLFSEEMTLESFTVKIIRHYLDRFNHNPTLVAQKLGIGRATVYRYIKNHNL